eukprot:TRINITY_DN55024_c0_g1_i1.p1 TRINITY_DN55024_c0_g1~~TRINITY_DN55024_c0_g1_i1.p1  ORF type:complete len:404 (+),score=124.15 TRINITY_DN55024_c0_g1_i1:81-1214(+)
MADDLVMDDCDDDDFVDTPVELPKPKLLTVERLPESGETIGPRDGQRMRQLLCGARHLPSSFAQQGFFFHPTIPYGLVQNEGGCCGVIAVVQAYVVKYMFYDQPRGGDVSPDYQDSVLADSMAAVLSWIMVVNGLDKMTLCLSPERGGATDIAGFRMFHFRDVGKVREAIRSNIREFSARRGAGLLQFMVSCVLTRGGADACEADMDNRCPLIVEHGYCSQELVNLLLTGKCVTNVFDGAVDLGGEANFQGVENRCNIGMLSLFEHYGSMRVGKNLKDPAYPIWVVCSESHYTVLFSDRRAPELTLPMSGFSLHYYDELANQDRPIRLHVNCRQGLTNEQVRGEHYKSPDQVPPVDDCIRTKWHGAVVTWEGSDPLL